MSLLESFSSVRTSPVDLDDLEDTFLAWVQHPAKPDVVDAGEHGTLAMAELSRQLADSQATLPASACAQLGLPPAATIATAATALLHATLAPDGPRCRSFRSASYYLRGLAHLDEDPLTIIHDLTMSTADATGQHDVR